ncbi:DNA replication complex GINS family protein [Candidatus Micrarchaeota archaeon]|nr:DNA replication complex GINS family protein [Candidatus Micrarchaeota archaeon]
MLNYSDLRDIQKRELGSSEAVSLPDDFYCLMSELLSKKKEDALSAKSIMAIKEYENLKKIIGVIASKREEKIVLMALRGETAGAGLTTEERDLLKGLSSIIMKSRENIKSVWDADETRDDSQKIKLLKNVEQYRGLDDSVYGPFKEGEEMSLPRPEAQWLLKSGLAEMVKL